MNELAFEQKTQDGIEFYVSEDGQTTGMSVRGLSRCCGVSSSSVSSLVCNEGVIGKELPKWLQPYTGQVFELSGKEGLAKIISSKVCARIITYYAYESKNAMNNIAKSTAEKFMSMGIDNWIKDLVGFEKVEEKGDRLANAIEVLISSVDGLKTEVEELKPIVKKYNHLKTGITVRFPGVETLIDDAEKNQQLLSSVDQVNLTLTEWLATKRVNMDRGGYCKFGRMVAETFRSCKLMEPKKTNKKKANGKWSNNVTVYNQDHFPILEMALTQFMQA